MLDFEFAGAASGEAVTAKDVGVIVKMYGQSRAYLFDAEFHYEFESWLSARFDADGYERNSEQYETPHEHLERIGCAIETFVFDKDGVWSF